MWADVLKVSPSILQTDMRRTLFLASVAIALSLQACTSPDGEPYGLFPAPSNGGYSEPIRPINPPSATPPPLVPPHHKMLENPDAEVFYEDVEVWATDEHEAAEKCRTIAESRTREGGTLVTVEGRPQRLTSKPSKYGSYRFNCRLRAEQ